jgi:hypothetical protein
MIDQQHRHQPEHRNRDRNSEVTVDSWYRLVSYRESFGHCMSLTP